MLSPSNRSYTATAGDSHTAQLSILSKAATINFYVITPNDAANVVSTFLEKASGDGTVTAASVDYTFPSNVSGDYTFYAKVYYNDGTSESPHPSYTVTVSLSSPTTPTFSLVPSDGSYTAEAGDNHDAGFTSSVPYDSVSWYIKTPSDLSNVYQHTATGDGSSTATGYLYTFPSGVSGDYVFKAKGTAGSAGFEESYTVSVSLPTTTETTTPTTPAAPVSAPVWSDIPDPIYVKVGDSFYLDLNSYVTGSTTITRRRNGSRDGGVPSGTSLIDGVISGTLKRAQTRSFRIEAINSAGSAYSEWIKVVVSARN